MVRRPHEFPHAKVDAAEPRQDVAQAMVGKAIHWGKNQAHVVRGGGGGRILKGTSINPNSVAMDRSHLVLLGATNYLKRSKANAASMRRFVWSASCDADVVSQLS